MVYNKYMEKIPPEEIKRMREIQETAQALGEERVKARKYTRKAKEELAKKPEVSDEAPNEAIIPMAEAQIKRKKAMKEAKKTEKEMGEVKIVKPIKTPTEMMEERSKKLSRAKEEAEETEKVLYAPEGDAQEKAKRHEDQIKILEQVAKQKAAERAKEGDVKKDIERLKQQREIEEAEKLRITREKEAGGAEGRAQRRAEEDLEKAKAYERLAEELKKPEQPPKKKSWVAKFFDIFRK